MKFVFNLFVILGISALIFGGIELTVRLFFPQTVSTTYIEGGPMAVPDPTLGYLNRPNTVARVAAPEYDAEYRVDADGFRYGAEGGQSFATNNARTVLLIGDSFTFGAANHYKDTWAARLAEAADAAGQPVNLVNAGVPGYSTTQQALYLERLFDDHQPETVILMFLPNDLFANEPIRTVDGLEVAERDASSVTGGRAKKKSSLQSLTLLKRLLMNFDGTYVGLYLMTPRRQFFEVPQSDLMTRKLETTKDVIARMADFTRSHGAELLVISVPQLAQVLVAASGAPDPSIDVHLIDRLLGDFADTQGVRWVSTLGPLTEAYLRDGRDLYFRFDGHLNARGNALMAQLVQDALLSELRIRSVSSD
ncbi:SGNH/GDSL hydrolase family protein [Oceanomicrobium pacificus]|uniref:SGNH hydrolase-type esterase domain-containing protein n=1 Tax=Oceanomicrobium pacificus TaxID=2692916 RepID=A0A6B0TV63_9RHOB|nr:GDSL-type esterase/lipase family protein [Oceanomicrobium pacificus]MXU65024.1 hypothetical protein [Oceanomicrobium pacificus]